MKTASRLAATLVFMTLASITATSPAWAGQGYESITGTFGEPCETSSPCPGGQLNGPTGVAVNYNTGNVYVVDTGDNRVEWFNSTGATFEGQFDGSGKYEVKGSKKTETPAPTGQLLEPEGIAIDNDPASPSYEDVYVADVGHDVIDKFTPTGEYLTQITGGKCEEPAELPPCAATRLISFTGEINIATDPNGNLWLYEVAPAIVYEYNPEGNPAEPPRTLENRGVVENSTPGFTVDANGDIYVAGFKVIYEYSQAKGYERETIKEPVSLHATLGVVSSTGRLLVDEGSSIELFGSPLRVFPAVGLSESGGVAVDGVNGEGTLYASERGVDEVAYFEPGAPGAPEIISATAFSRTREEGAFEVVINPNNRDTKYHINYSPKLNSGGELESPETLDGAELFAEFTEANTTVGGALFAQFENVTGSYYYQVTAENELGDAETAVKAYTKLPIVASEAVPELTSTGATLDGEVNPDFLEAAYTIYLADKQQYEHGESVPINAPIRLPQERRAKEAEQVCPGIVEQNGAGEMPEEIDTLCPVSAEIEGLTPGETYHFRIVANNAATRTKKNANEGKPIDGEWVAFTPYAAPTVTGGQATAITSNSASLSGEANPEGAPGSSYFAYITAAEYEKALNDGAANPAQPGYQTALEDGAPSPYTQGSTTTTVTLPAARTIQPIGPIPATGLRANTTYHYALVATNQYGLRTYGPDHTFTTQPEPPPTITTGPAIAITETTATLTAAISTNGQATTYAFEVTATPGSYGPPIGLGAIPEESEGTSEVSVALGELEPGTVYHYRVVASSGEGSVHGLEQSFATTPAPGLLTIPLSLPALNVMAPPPIVEKAIRGPPLTRAQKLAKALKLCRRDSKSKGRRQRCETTARKKYGPAKKHRQKK